MGRWGEKVPAAVGTVGHALDLLDLGPPSHERACVRFRPAELAAVGTGLLGGELVGLLPEEELECSLGQPLGRRGGDLLHGSEVDAQVGSVVAEGASGDDLPSLGGECAELVGFLGGEAGCDHGSIPPELTPMTVGGFPIPHPSTRKAPHEPRRDLVANAASLLTLQSNSSGFT
jgi:hypothetical protein